MSLPGGTREGARVVGGVCHVTLDHAPVVQRLDSAIPRINLYPVDIAIIISFPNTYPLDGDLSSGWRYPMLEQPGPDENGTRQKEGKFFAVCAPTLLPLWVLLHCFPSLSLWRKVGEDSGNEVVCVHPSGQFHGIFLTTSSSPFFLRDSRATETRVHVKITPHQKRRHDTLSPPRVTFSCVG